MKANSNGNGLLPLPFMAPQSSSASSTVAGPAHNIGTHHQQMNHQQMNQHQQPSFNMQGYPAPPLALNNAPQLMQNMAPNTLTSPLMQQQQQQQLPQMHIPQLQPPPQHQQPNQPFFMQQQHQSGMIGSAQPFYNNMASQGAAAFFNNPNNSAANIPSLMVKKPFIEANTPINSDMASRFPTNPFATNAPQAPPPQIPPPQSQLNQFGMFSNGPSHQNQYQQNAAFNSPMGALLPRPALPMNSNQLQSTPAPHQHQQHHIQQQQQQSQHQHMANNQYGFKVVKQVEFCVSKFVPRYFSLSKLLGNFDKIYIT